MSILVPLNDVDYLDRYLAAGADEFYCGFLDYGWSSRFGSGADLNRMSGFGPVANCSCFDELLFVTQLVKAAGARMFVPFNAASYTAEQIAYQDYWFEWLARYGADGVIVSQPEQVPMARRWGLDAVVSTLGAVYNRPSAAWWAHLGATRVILPRDLTLAEIESIAAAVPGIEYEAFLMRNGCRYSDSHCLGRHGGSGKGGLCVLLNQANKLVHADGEADLSDAEATSRLYCDRFHENACGLCALWRLARSGVSTFKIVGRSDDPETMDGDIRLAARNLAIARGCATEEEYLGRMERPHGVDRARCDRGLNCYYPEVRFGG